MQAEQQRAQEDLRQLHRAALAGHAQEVAQLQKQLADELEEERAQMVEELAEELQRAHQKMQQTAGAMEKMEKAHEASVAAEVKRTELQALRLAEEQRRVLALEGQLRAADSELQQERESLTAMHAKLATLLAEQPGGELLGQLVAKEEQLQQLLLAREMEGKENQQQLAHARACEELLQLQLAEKNNELGTQQQQRLEMQQVGERLQQRLEEQEVQLSLLSHQVEAQRQEMAGQQQQADATELEALQKLEAALKNAGACS